MAQHLAGSNTGGGYGYLNWLRGSKFTPFHPPRKSDGLVRRSNLRREGKAVVLIPPKEYWGPATESQA